MVAAKSPNLSAIVSHRTWELSGAELVQKLREANSQVPIVMVSGIDRTGEAVAAGATRFLLYDEWLRIGTVVAELLNCDTAARAGRNVSQRN